jgi:hypothetical protein
MVPTPAGLEMHLRTAVLIEVLDEIEQVIGKAASNGLRTLLIDAKEARLVTCEVALFALSFEIDSPQIIPIREAEAIHRRDIVLVQWGEITTELDELQPLYAPVG